MDKLNDSLRRSLMPFLVRLDFFDDILVPPGLMFPGSFLYVYPFLVIVPLHDQLSKRSRI